MTCLCRCKLPTHVLWHIGTQDIPYSVLTMLYILETDKPSPTVVLLSFATSLIYLGCASLVICCASSELGMSCGPSAESA